jgi:hypothetical protein
MAIISKKRLDKMIEYYGNPDTEDIDWNDYNKTISMLKILFKDTHTALKNYKALRSLVNPKW